MPLDQVVYVPTVGGRLAFLAAVRGGYLFSFDPDTGARTQAVRYCTPCFGEASIAYEAVNDKLVVSFWNEQRANDSGVANLEPTINKRIYRISPATLGVEASAIVSPHGAGSEDTQPWDGPHQIVAYGGFIWGTYWGKFGFQYTGYFKLDPLTLTVVAGGSASDQVQGVSPESWVDIAIDATNSVLWVTNPSSELIEPKALTDLTLGSSGVASVDTTSAFSAPWPVAYGVCFCAVTGKVYATCRSQTVVTVVPNGAVAKFNTGDLAAFPYRIRYCDQVGNPYYQKVIVPGYASNNVTVITPASNACTIKSGFDSPFDVVFTPTKAWAVQHGVMGLKLIS